MRPPRVRNPIIPANKTERTGTGRIIRRAVAQINVRFAQLQRDVLAAFARIPTYALNDAKVLYGLTPQQMQQLTGELQASLDAAIVRQGADPGQFWWSPFVQEANQLGTAQSVANLTNLSSAYGAGRSLQTVIFSDAYRNRVGIAQTKSYEHWTGLASSIRAELSDIIGSAVADGRNPKEVSALIRDRLDVSASKAKQYAQTDITDSLRQARMAEADVASADYGLNIGLLWTSAFLPTTRSWHASRNGSVYTSAQVRDFYNERGNRYNCHCATTECLMDSDGKPILSDSLKASMKKEKEDWQAEFHSGSS